jgi:hypothetical protein
MYRLRARKRDLEMRALAKLVVVVVYIAGRIGKL